MTLRYVRKTLHYEISDLDRFLDTPLCTILSAMLANNARHAAFSIHQEPCQTRAESNGESEIDAKSEGE